MEQLEKELEQLKQEREELAHEREELQEEREQILQEQEHLREPITTSSEPEETEGNITLDALRAILEQNEINDNDMNQIIIYSKKNKRNTKLIKQIRQRFNF